MDFSAIQSLRYSSKGYKQDPPARIHPRILIGAGEMLTPQFAKKYEITHVINCANETDSPTWFKEEFPQRYVCIEAVDSPHVNILKWYPTFKSFIRYFMQHPESKTVFVHCQCGINRSAFLALMYVCEAFGFPVAKTEFSLLRQRPCALTNESFRSQVYDALAKK